MAVPIIRVNESLGGKLQLLSRHVNVISSSPQIVICVKLFVNMTRFMILYVLDSFKLGPGKGLK